MSEQEIEVKPEAEIETLPDAGGLVSVDGGKKSVEDQLFLADNIEKIIAAQNKIRTALLKLAQPGDWVLFGSEGTQKAEVGAAGALRIGSTLGVSFTNWSVPKKENGTDEIGEWYRWEFECDASFRDRTVRVWGRAGSRDKFFGKSQGVWKPLHMVDEGNIKMAGRRAAMKEGVKVLFGLHHMDPAFLTANGITLAKAGGHDFKPKTEGAPQGKASDNQESPGVIVGIESVTVTNGVNKKTNKPWKKSSIMDVEGVIYTTFSESFATTAKDIKEKKGLAAISYKVGEWGNEILTIEGAQK